MQTENVTLFLINTILWPFNCKLAYLTYIGFEPFWSTIYVTDADENLKVKPSAICFSIVTRNLQKCFTWKTNKTIIEINNTLKQIIDIYWVNSGVKHFNQFRLSKILSNAG